MTKYRVTFEVEDPNSDYQSFRAEDLHNWYDTDGEYIGAKNITVEELDDPPEPGWYKFEGSLYKLWQHNGLTKGARVKLPEINETYGTMSPAIMDTPFTITEYDGWKMATKVDL